mmetsp:Transcript_31993/g.74661  ORF Transcript_31993/g.74661 Transcript_31993/m.74661 type:complete len:307 (-) Transcript_31993:104-1024(-)
MRMRFAALLLGRLALALAGCTHVTRDGQECAPAWDFEGVGYAGCTLNNSATAGVEWCVTSKNADWHEGWGVCAPGCLEALPTPCPRIAQSGAKCRERWEYKNVVYRGCTTHLGRGEWCATQADATGPDAPSVGELSWEYCKPLSAACLRDGLPKGADASMVLASPPPPPPIIRDTRTVDRCQHVTDWGEKCFDTWHYKGLLQHQCTTVGSSIGREWCATSNRQHWDWCRSGCVTYGTACPRVTVTGARCLKKWSYHNTIFEGCTSEWAVYFFFLLFYNQQAARVSGRCTSGAWWTLTSPSRGTRAG